MNSITLQTNDTIVVSGDLLGQLQFAAPTESDGGAAIAVSARIKAIGDGAFQTSSHPAAIVFGTSTTDANAVSDKLKISHAGHFLPLSNDTYDLGESSYRFNDLHVANIYADLVTASTGNLDVLSFNTDNESILSKGQINWDDTQGVLDVGLTDTTTMHVGQHRFYRVRNTTGGVLYKGQIVYATGVHSNGIITPNLYVANGTIDEIRFIGVILEDISNNNNGYAIDFGHVENIDLDGSTTNYAVGDETWSNGDILYAHPTSNGKLTNAKPKHAISIAIILDVGTGNGNGRMFVRPKTFGDLNDNHDVSVGSATNGQFLQYNATTDYWVPSSSGNFTTLQLNGSDVLVEHPAVSAASSSDNSGRTYIQDIGLDSFGHVTSIATATETVTDTDTNYYLDGITKAGNTLTFSVNGATNQDYTFGSNAFTSYTDHSTQGYLTAHPTISAASSVDNSNGNVIQDVTLDSNGHVTALVSFDLDGRYYTESEIDAFNYVDGNGTASYLSKWSDTDTLTNSIIYDNGTNIGIGQTSPSYKLEINGNIGLTSDGFYASPTGVMIGTNGWLYNDGQIAVSHGSFSSNGDAQNSIYVLRGSTTNATFTTIQNNGSNVVLASNRTMMFTANIVGRSTNSADNAAYKIEGVLYNDGYGASIIGTPVKTILGETDSSWDVQATISGAGAGGSDYLNIQVKGATSKNVNWVAKLEILEVGGDITGYTEANILGIDSSIIP